MAKYKLKNDRLWQWDSGQYVEVPADYTTCESQFYSSNYKEGLTVTTTSYVTEGTKVYCPIPNQLLTDSVDIVIYAYSRGTGTTHTETATVINVMERLKPNDYAYTPTEVQTFESLKTEVQSAVATVEGYEDRLEDVEDTLPTKLSDAPSDNKQYARKNGAWAEVQGGSGGTVEWDNIQNKPSTFPPSSHNQAWSTITDKPSTYPPEEHNQGWSTITDKPSTYPPEEHNQGWSTITDKPETYPPSSHTHAWSSVTDKPETFTPSAHNQAWSTITDKPETYPPSSHTHTKSEITDFPTNVSTFTNDAGYLTSHQSLAGYATQTWVGQQGYLTSHQDISGKEDKSNKVTSFSDTPSDTNYPSEKLVYDELSGMVTLNTDQTLESKKTFKFTEPMVRGGQETIVNILSTHRTDDITEPIWTGRMKIGNRNKTFILGVYRQTGVAGNEPICGMGAHKWSDSFDETGADWESIYLNPDGGKAVYIGGKDWRADSGWLRVQNSGNDSGGKVYYNKGTISSPNWQEVATTSNLTTKENTSNKVTTLSASSTNTQYPSAKCVYDIVGNIESLLEALL